MRQVVSGTNLVSDKTRYLHRDHIGSVDVVTDEEARPENTEYLSYDAHGKRRETDWRPAGGLIVPLETPRGFTGHEHLDMLGLIHMNGRVYDPVLGRFLSADPFVQFPETTQGFNRYSYAANNPLSATDPSGFFLKKFFKKIGKFFKKFGSMIAQVVVPTVVCGGNPVCAAGVAAGISGFTSVAAGGSMTDAMTAAAITFGTAMAFNGIGEYFDKFDSLTKFQSVQKVVAHGVVGGVSSKLQGGKFASGFISAAAVQGFGQLGGFEALGLDTAPQGTGDWVKNAVASAVIGGAASALGGGKFANGAVSGAFSRLFNDVYHLPDENGNEQALMLGVGDDLDVEKGVRDGVVVMVIMGGLAAGPYAIATAATYVPLPFVQVGVYVLPAESGLPYVGAGVIATRLARHVNSGRLLKDNIGKVLKYWVPGGKNSKLNREIFEQNMMKRYGGLRNLDNVRNNFGSDRWQKFRQYLDGNYPGP